ncbi:hypothetical protein DSL92_02405 [Billgrantia gudaonensis]|uniref:Uncharacterized protein n=1 Tax=Billgrantia gudaonensis TaxID=376427 RepID=A0A3S0QGB9_9GAMM|nr:hypothetical protein DSL92_02405 [Halomonas gudaonensis]
MQLPRQENNIRLSRANNNNQAVRRDGAMPTTTIMGCAVTRKRAQQQQHGPRRFPPFAPEQQQAAKRSIRTRRAHPATNKNNGRHGAPSANNINKPKGRQPECRRGWIIV